MTRVDKTDPRFVRCLKPNPEKKPNNFSHNFVVQQLRCGGVLQAVEASRSGYPIRATHDGCWLDFSYALIRNDISAMAKVKVLVDKSPEERVRGMMQIYDRKFNLSEAQQGWDVGKTLVFMKQYVYEILTEARNEARRQREIFEEEGSQGLGRLVNVLEPVLGCINDLLDLMFRGINARSLACLFPPKRIFC